MLKRFCAILLGLAIASAGVAAPAPESYTIGVLAKRGTERFYERWLPTATYLREKTGQEFTVKPLAFEEIEPALQKKEIQFLLTNSSMFVSLQEKYSLTPAATMINISALGHRTNKFGGVLLTSQRSKDINSLQDIAGKPFIAVNEDSFGGYQMAIKEGLDQGVDIRSVAKTITFTGSHDKVVKQVIAQPGSAGTVRTDILEQMYHEGSLAKDQVRVLNPRELAGFPFQLSTALYPEWPLAATSSVPKPLFAAVQKALTAMSPDDFPARSPNIAGWSAPLDYSGVKGLLLSLGLL